jgi:hypothetical protein
MVVLVVAGGAADFFKYKLDPIYSAFSMKPKVTCFQAPSSMCIMFPSLLVNTKPAGPFSIL